MKSLSTVPDGRCCIVPTKAEKAWCVLSTVLLIRLDVVDGAEGMRSFYFLEVREVFERKPEFMFDF